jgi:hypothetical protein
VIILLEIQRVIDLDTESPKRIIPKAMAGRPSGFDLLPDSDVDVGEDVTVLDSRGRFLIPSWVATSVSWLQSSQKKVPCYSLAICAKPGAIRLLHWEDHSGPVLQRRKALVEKGELDSILLLEYRYRRILIPKDFRPTIGASGAAHLGVNPETTVSLYVGFSRDSISIISQAYREKEIADAEANGLFLDLP